MIQVINDLNDLSSNLISAKTRYENHYQKEMVRYRQAVTQHLQVELNRVLSFLVRDRSIAGINQMSRSVLFQAILSEMETAMDLCVLGPPLRLFPLNDFSYGLIAYGAFGVMKSAVENPFQPTRNKPFIDYLTASGFDARTAGAVGVMAASAVINAVAEICLNHRPTDVTQILMRASEHFSSGVLTRPKYRGPLSYEPYETIVRREEIPGHMMLEHIFLRTAPSYVRYQLLEIAFNIHLFRHMISIIEELDDPFGNICSINDANFSQFIHLLWGRVQKIRTDTLCLTPNLRDAVATRLLGWLDRFRNLL